MAQTDHAGKKKRPRDGVKSKYCWEKHTPQGKNNLVISSSKLIFPSWASLYLMRSELALC
jgi:hypothetical protein